MVDQCNDVDCRENADHLSTTGVGEKQINRAKTMKILFNSNVRYVVVYLRWHSQILLITIQSVQLTQSLLLHSDSRSMPIQFETMRIPNYNRYDRSFHESNVIN